MTAITPITLIGENLGKRHSYLNSLVSEAYKNKDDFIIIQDLPEISPVDRIFKIDLASKLRNIDYIIKNIKNDDLLYVNRALKSNWLIESKYENIINPQYLEERLYPEMITTAVTKLKNWIYINLKDEVRCQQFYKYYHVKNYDYAIKFLFHSTKEFIQEEFPTVVHKVSPHYLKILSEKCPQVAKIFFDLLSNDEKLKILYLHNESDYFYTVKCLLKADAQMTLDITEKYFNKDRFTKFSPSATKYILKNHKNRFFRKPELYAAWLINMKTLAKCLSVDEAKDLVIKLAQAKYLTYLNWFCYKAVEPLIKRLKPNDRAAFKKKVFIDKDIGEEYEVWPYEPAWPPTLESQEYSNVFEDYQPDPNEYERLGKVVCKRMIKKRKFRGENILEIISCGEGKTMLDKLFNEFRFASFGKTMYDLRKRIAAESSSQNREYIMLVLVSKSGGRPDAIASLLELLVLHSNDPSHVRATIIRSLVKRGCVWRLPENTWNQFLAFGRGLGLDGNPSDAECNEGLHAVVIRSFLLTGECQQAIKEAYMRLFSNFTIYSLSIEEKKRLGELVPKMLLDAAKETENVQEAVKLINKLFEALEDYKIKFETYPGLIDAVADLAEKNLVYASPVLKYLYNHKIARKQLFKYNFNLYPNDAAYVNALRHDPSVIDINKLEEYTTSCMHLSNVKSINTISIDQCVREVAIYFGENNGLSSKFLGKLKSAEINKNLARPLTILLGGQLGDYLDELDVNSCPEIKSFASRVRANVHLARPALDINAFGWRKVGAKAISNRLLICRTVDIENNVSELLKWKRTARLAYALSKRINYETEVLAKVAEMRPTTAIKLGLKLLRNDSNNKALQTWEIIKPLIEELDITTDKRQHLRNNLTNIRSISVAVKPEYSTIIYIAFKKISFYASMPPLSYVEITLPSVNEYFVSNFLSKFLQEDFTIGKLSGKIADKKCTKMFIRILVKYLLLCKNNEIQKHRLATIGDKFLERMEDLRKSPDHKDMFNDFLDTMIITLKYCKVFLNIEYVSCLPVIERVVVWLQKNITIVENFEMYAHLHLTMLFFKATRKGLKLAPEIFADDKNTILEGEKIVGNIFGNYIIKELRQLIAKYFESVIQIYSKCLLSYLDKYCVYSYQTSIFLSSMMKGILEICEGPECCLGIEFYKEKRFNLKQEHLKEVENRLKEMKGAEARWFLLNEIC